MAAENKLVILVEGDSSSLQKELQNSVKSIQKTGTELAKVGQTSGNKFGNEFGKGAQSGLRLVTEGFKPIEDAAGVSFSGIASNFKNLLLNPVTAGVALIGAGLVGAFKAAQVGEEIEKINSRFENLATSAGVVGSKLKDGLVEAAAGLTGTEELLEVASKAIITLGTNAERLPELFVLAQKAVTVFGGTAEGRLEEITRAISNLQTKQLKQIGLNIDTAKAFEVYAASIGKVAKDLTEAEQKQALLNAVIQTGSERFKNIDTEVNKPTISNGLKRLTEGLNDLKDSFANFANSSFGSAIGAFLINFGNGLTVISEKTDKLFGAQGSLQDQLNATRGKLLELSIALKDSSASDIAIKRTQAEIDVLKKKEIAIENQIAAEQKLIQENKKKSALESAKVKSESEIQAEQDKRLRIAEINAEADALEIQAEIDKQLQLAEINNVTNPNQDFLRQAQLQQILDTNQKELDLALEKNQRIKDIEERSALDSLARARKLNADKKAIGDNEVKEVKIREATKEEIQRANLAAAGNIIQAGLTLAKQGSAAQKALNVAAAIQSTYLAATVALGPPPGGLGPIAGKPLAISTIALGLANVAKITAAKDGALVTRGIPGQDTEPFMLAKGEIVAPAKSFDEVVEGTARQRGFVKQEQVQNQQSPQINITINGDMLADDVYITRLVEQIREAVQFRGADLGV